ncbi:MAG: hypothetical protein QOG33_1043 [Gaiellales bacterium]|nr:hypothetical protein [Gaiellales bacterium]
MSSAGEPRDATRPVLLAVDDEPSVARAVEPDLRRRYGRDVTLRSQPGSTEFVVTLPIGKAVAAAGEA